MSLSCRCHAFLSNKYRQIVVLLSLLLLGHQSEASQLRFLSPLEDSIVIEDEPASFKCQAKNDGQSPIVFQWFLDSQEIHNSSDHFLFDNGTLHYPSITIPGAVTQSASILKCKASDEIGAIISRDATIQLAYLSEYSSTARIKQEEIGTNNTVYFECPDPFPDSIPKAEIIWLKDNVEFTGGLDLGRYSTSLQIPSATSSLDGSYTCKFWNSLLRKSVTSPAVQLTVKPSRRKLHFASSSGSLTKAVSVGASVLFECVAVAASPPSVTWSKLNGQLPSERVNYIGSNLKIMDVQSGDAGQYECLASLGGGSSQTYFRLEIDEPPIIEEFLPSFNDSKAIQHFFTASCTVYGKPKPDLYWSFNGVPLNQSELVRLGVTNSTSSDQLRVTLKLTIDGVSKNNEGYYQCFASNFAGDVNRQFFLQVLVPPSLVVSPQSKNVLANQPFTLNCEIAGSPAPSLTWTLNGQTITQNGRRIITGTPYKDRVKSQLHVDQSGHEDSGMYTCDGKNGAASTSSTAVQVLVYVGAEITKIQDVKAHINTTVMLKVEIIGLPSPSVKWYFSPQSNPISSTGSHYEIFTNGTLKIVQLRFIDVGQYDIEVQNIIDGQEYRHRKQLSLSVLPTISMSKKENEPSIVGTRTNLWCTSEANPPPSIILWYKDGNSLQTSDDEQILITYDKELYRLTSILLINETGEDDFGNYSCKAISDAGESPLASTRLMMGYLPTPDPNVKAESVGGGDDGLSVTAIGIIVAVLLFLVLTTVVIIAVWAWRRRQSIIQEKSVASQVQLERVMRQSDQTSPSFYASSGPHPALELEMNDDADCSVHTSGDKDVSFSSFRRRREAPSLAQSPTSLAGQERESIQHRMMGRRSTGYGRHSAGGDSTDLPPYSVRDPLRSPTFPGGPLVERVEPSATAISTDVDSFYSDQKRISYRSNGSTSGQVTGEGQESTDISTVV